MNDPKPQRSSDRLKDIERRISQIEGAKKAEDAPRHNGLPAGMGAILGRVATELVAGVLVGSFIGWVLDRWLETSPLFLVMIYTNRDLSVLLRVDQSICKMTVETFTVICRRIQGRGILHLNPILPSTRQVWMDMSCMSQSHRIAMPRY